MILITGGAGYVGSHVAHLFCELGHDVTVLDDLSTGSRWAVPVAARFVEMNLSDEAGLASLFASETFTAIVHLAASVQVGESVANPELYYRNNTVNTLRVMEAAKKAGVRSILFSSTGAVYGESRGAPFKESDLLQPINPYGWSKLFAERIVRDVVAASGADEKRRMNFAILRYFNVAGARFDLKLGQGGNIVSHVTKAACLAAVGVRDRVEISGVDYPTADGSCERDYVHVMDVARAHVDALSYLQRGGASDVFNVGYGHATSVRKIVETVKAVSGVDFPVVETARRPGDPARLEADVTKIRRVLGWEPKHDDLREICRSAFEWERVIQARSNV